MFYGLDALVANGSNRLGILFQSAVSSVTFCRKGLVEKTYIAFVIPALLGALLGAYLASVTPEAVMQKVILFVVIMMLLLALFSQLFHKKLQKVATLSMGFFAVLLLFCLGLYGGYIQVGYGLFMIALLNGLFGFDLKKVNVIKNLVVFVYSLPVFCFFYYKGLVALKPALFLAAGQGLGGFLGAKFLLECKQAEKWVRRLFYVMLVLCVVKLVVG